MLGENSAFAGMVRAMHAPEVADFETVLTLARAQAEQAHQPSCRTGSIKPLGIDGPTPATRVAGRGSGSDVSADAAPARRSIKTTAAISGVA